MAKTTKIEVICRSITVEPYTHHGATAILDHPEVETILENMEKDDITDYARDAFDPEDIFSETQLERWAEANGYVKADS